MSLDVLRVANYLVELDCATRRRPALTNMALQKLLYLAEGQHLAQSGGSLFANRIEAWEYGPVIPDAYRAFRHCGAQPIREPARVLEPDGRVWRWRTPSLATVPAAAQERAFVARLYEQLGGLTAERLMAACRPPGGPWQQADARGVHVAIDRGALRSYFSAHPVLA